MDTLDFVCIFAFFCEQDALSLQLFSCLKYKQSIRLKAFTWERYNCNVAQDRLNSEKIRIDSSFFLNIFLEYKEYFVYHME